MWGQCIANSHNAAIAHYRAHNNGLSLSTAILYFPFSQLCSLSDIFGALNVTSMSISTLGAKTNDDDCSLLTLSWSCPSLNFSHNGHLSVNNITGRLVNYTLVFSGVENLKNWTVQLNTTTLSYSVTGLQMLDGEEYIVRLKIDAILQNRSYLHLTSQAFYVIVPDCSGKAIYC